MVRAQTMMRAIWLAWLVGCVNVESAPIDRNGNLTCMYGDAVVFSGGFEISGEGADQLDLDGTWRLCKEESVSCTLTSTTGR